MKDNNIVLEKTKSFAIRIVKLCKYLNDNKEITKLLMSITKTAKANN